MTKFRSSLSLARGMLAGLACAVFAGTAYAQGLVITGTVKSEQGQPLNSAQVYIAEMTISVPTNDRGEYRISIPAERVRGQQAMLRARSIGYVAASELITLTAGTLTKDFALKVDVNRLSEVVVTGVTGATEQKKLAFTVDRIDQADLKMPSASALTALQGKVTGAQIVLPNGRPGTAPSILLRGVKSINRPLDPLIVVDGVILNGSMTDLDPNDIESIEVVKGAAASSTFGSRAQNGVIQITTKGARNAGQGARFNLRSEYGFQDVQTEYPFAKYNLIAHDETNQKLCAVVPGYPNCSMVVDFAEEAKRINNVPTPDALDPYLFLNDFGISATAKKPYLKGTFQINPWPVRYNPIAQAVLPGAYNDTHLDMTARFGQTGVFASLGGLYQEGSIRGLQGYRRKTARLNADQTISEDLSFQMATTFAKTTNYPSVSFFRLTRAPAGVDLLRRDDYGRLFIRSNPMNQGKQNENFLYDTENAEARTNVDRYLGSLTGRYTPLSWLEFQSVTSLDVRRNDNYSLTEKGYRVTSASQSNDYLGSISHGNTNDQAYNVSLTGTGRFDNPFGFRDLNVRLNSSYNFERQDGHDVSASGNTLTVPGVLYIRNAVVQNAPQSSNVSARAMGVLSGIAFDYKGRYLADATYRRDGSSLFGVAQRWHSYYRASMAWRLSDEPWWFFKGALNDFKLRASVGTAGGRPGQTYQYETFNIGTGGTLSASQLGNKNLKPENTTETEYGIDAELFSKYGLTLTYARDITKDQMLSVPVSSSSGFSTQWRNAGQLDGKTWEASLNVPLITSRNVVWTSRISYDRTRSVITGLDVPPFTRYTDDNSNTQFQFRVGERIGQLWGKHFLRACSELPTDFQGDCGAGKSYQLNSDGFLVWTGGFDPGEGITRNVWQSQLNGCQVNGKNVSQTGIINCLNAGGVVMTPMGQNTMHWGMLMGMRDSSGAEILVHSGNTLPDFHLSLSQNFNYKRVTLYALVDGSYGNRLYNNEIHWSLGDFNVRWEDQDGKTVETAKPMGYYWRGTSPENNNGTGGMYDALGGNNITIQKGSYTKLREVSLSYNVGPVRGVGDWSISADGRNLWTITDYLGWDPEVGGGGAVSSDAVGAATSFGYPPTRTFTITLQTRF